MPTVSEIRPVKKSAEAELLKRPGVTGVDIGYKFVDGKKTSTLAIRVYVEKKRDVPAREAIPETISEVKTDVIERRFELKPRMMRVLDLVPEVDTGEYDPLRGGMSIGPCRQVFLDAAEAACHDAPGPAYRAAQSSELAPVDKRREQNECDSRVVVRAARSDLALDVTGKLFSEEDVFRRQLRTRLEHQPQKAQQVSEKSERRSQHVCRIITSATRHHRVDCGKRAE